MQLALQLLDPPAILSGLRCTGRTRLAETGDRILLPAIQLRRIQPLLAAPGAACRLIQRSRGDHSLQSRRSRPALAADARSIGQGIRPPSLQRRYTDAHLTRHMLHRGTLGRQQSRHYPVFVRLSVSSHFLIPRPQRFRSYLGGNCSDTGGGATHGYFGHEEWAAIAPGLKSVEDATSIRSRILAAFEEAEATDDPVRRATLLTFLVCGAGPTGVELAGAIAELARHGMEKEFRYFDPASARILLVQAGPRVLPQFAERLSAFAQVSLEALGVEVRVNSRVDMIDGDGV